MNNFAVAKSPNHCVTFLHLADYFMQYFQLVSGTQWVASKCGLG